MDKRHLSFRPRLRPPIHQLLPLSSISNINFIFILKISNLNHKKNAWNSKQASIAQIIFWSKLLGSLTSTFEMLNPGLYAFSSNLGLHEFWQGCTQNFCTENQAQILWKSEVPSKPPCPGINHIWSEKSLIFKIRNTVNKAKAPRQDNTPKFTSLLRSFFFFFFNMYRKKQHYDKATPLDWRTLKIQRVDWAQL